MPVIDTVPRKNEEYGTKEYWESEDSAFDWFKSYHDLAEIFANLIPDKTSRILILGCGNSKLSEEMWEDGYCNIVNVDYSSVVIDKMRRQLERTHPQMEWHTMDVRDLSFDAETFDVAIDKGTMDAMLTFKGDVWDPPANVVSDCMKETDEAIRVLRRNTGIFLYLTFGQPHFRRQYLIRPGTQLEIKELGDSFHYYLYILRKL